MSARPRRSEAARDCADRAGAALVRNCSRCRISKADDAFYWQFSTRRRYRDLVCSQCRIEQQAQRRREAANVMAGWSPAAHQFLSRPAPISF